MAYRALRVLIRLLLWLFYRRIEVVGGERVPAMGPVILVANHHNALVDPMLLVALCPRPIVALAKAPLFRHPLIAPFLYLAGAVPVSRRLEGDDDPARNEAMFAAAVEALRRDRVLLIFPEGRSQPQPTLLPARTGAARILLGAGSDAERVTLVPVGMVFDDPGTFRSAAVQVTIGEPVPTADLIALHRERPVEAVRALTARLEDAIRGRIVEAEDQYTLGLLAVVERAWSEQAARPGDAEATLAWKQQVMRGARFLGEREPARVAALRQRAALYRAHLDEVGISSAQLGRPYTAGLVARYALENAVWLALGLPIALWGFACHALPYWLTGRVVRLLHATEEEEATYKLAVGLLVYPACWTAEAWLAWRLGGVAGLLLFVVLVIPSGLLALAWHERLGRVWRQARAFAWFLTDRALHDRLLAERRALVEELRALGNLVPPDLR